MVERGDRFGQYQKTVFIVGELRALGADSTQLSWYEYNQLPHGSEVFAKGIALITADSSPEMAAVPFVIIRDDLPQAVMTQLETAVREQFLTEEVAHREFSIEPFPKQVIFAILSSLFESDGSSNAQAQE